MLSACSFLRIPKNGLIANLNSFYYEKADFPCRAVSIADVV